MVNSGIYDFLPNVISGESTTMEPIVWRAIERFSAATSGLSKETDRLRKMGSLITSNVALSEGDLPTECWVLTDDYLGRNDGRDPADLRRSITYGVLSPVMIGLMPYAAMEDDRVKLMLKCLGHTRCRMDCVRPDHLYYRDSESTHGIDGHGVRTTEMLSARLGMRPSGPTPRDPENPDEAIVRAPSLAMVRGMTEDRGRTGYSWIAKDRDGYAGRYRTSAACAAVLYEREWLRRNPEGEELIESSVFERGATGHRRSRAAIERERIACDMFGVTPPDDLDANARTHAAISGEAPSDPNQLIGW